MAKETRFDRLMRAGKVMTPQEREECVRGLLLEDRFAGVLGLVLELKDAYVDESSDQRLASSPGKQCHAWGSVDGLRALEARLRVVCERGARRKGEQERTEGTEG
jgi:hypothetical protein